MVNPIKAAGRLVEPITSTLGSFIGHATSMPGSGAPAPTVTAPPPLAPDATTPTAKANKKGIQQSFLSGVAASGLSGAASGGSSGGKTLLGA
jgi:hypothetical protein